MTGYVRADTTDKIANGNVIDATYLDQEFDAIQAAFNAVGGHKHDGTTGNGAPITAVGPAQDVTISATVVAPKTDNTVDLGSSLLEWKDLHVDGVGNIDTIISDAGTITTLTSTGITTTSLATTNLLVGGDTVVGGATTQTLTNKTIDLTNNTLIATSAQLASAITDETGTGALVFQTSPSLGGVPTAPTALAGTNTAQLATTAHVFNERSNAATLTNKTLTSPVIDTATVNSPTIVGGSITGITDLAVADGGTGASTATGALLNFGITASQAEINKLNGATVSTVELNYLSGVTYNINAAILDLYNIKQPLDAGLTELSNLASGGIVVRTTADAFRTRTLLGTTDQITVTNGDGLAGDITIAGVVASNAEALLGLNNTKLMTPLRVSSAIQDYVNSVTLGVGQTWINYKGTGTRLDNGTIYQNTTGRPIQLAVGFDGDFNSADVQVSEDGVTWVVVYEDDGDGSPAAGAYTILPNLYYYKVTRSGGSLRVWAELR